jgi:ABC-2 type transport system ATP-binding protein
VRLRSVEDACMHELLDVERLVKRYRNLTAVAGVSFSVHPGETCGLLGPNGSGKSSTLHAVVGVVPPSDGRVRIAGHPADSPAAKRHLGFVPDDLRLPAGLTGAELLALVERLQPAADRSLMDFLVDLLGLGPALSRLVGEYSHGMQRKLQLVAALLHRPELLVLDEPFLGLDPEAALVLRTVLARFTQQGGAVLIATHDLLAAERYCDQVVILSEGRVVAEGPPGGLLARHRASSLEGVFLVATGLKERVQAARTRLGEVVLAGNGSDLAEPDRVAAEVSLADHCEGRE